MNKKYKITIQRIYVVPVILLEKKNNKTKQNILAAYYLDCQCH
jgi:hypothetical protein